MNSPWNLVYGHWREDTLRRDQPGPDQPQWPPALPATANPPMPVPGYQTYDEQNGLTEWELALRTAHEFVMTQQNSVGTAPITLPSSATLHVGYMRSDTNMLSVIREVQEVESLLSVFKLDDDDIRPPQTRSLNHQRFAVTWYFLDGRQCTPLTKDPRTHGQAQNNDAQVYELAQGKVRPAHFACR